MPELNILPNKICFFTFPYNFKAFFYESGSRFLGSGSEFCPDPDSGKKSDPDPDKRTRKTVPTKCYVNNE